MHLGQEYLTPRLKYAPNVEDGTEMELDSQKPSACSMDGTRNV